MNPLLALLLIALAGCTGLVKKAEVAETKIVWAKRLPATKCNATGLVLGCAHRTLPDYSACLIEMPEDSPDWVIAHEFRHCFGWEHGG